MRERVYITLSALPPKDWMLLVYMIYSTPFLFFGASTTGDVVWVGVFLRILALCLIPFARYYLAVVPDEQHKRRTLFTLNDGRAAVLVLPYVSGLALDFLHVVCCVYFYSEDGAIIKNMYSYPHDFYDLDFQHIDVKLAHLHGGTGVGYALRGATGHGSLFNRILGEYLSFAYIFFYFLIASAYLVPYAHGTRHTFDVVTTGLIMAYLVALATFALLPTAGPFWALSDERPEAQEIGYFFAALSQTLIKGGSAIGTAFPSSHCAVTTVSFVLSLVYCTPLGIFYISLCPALVFGTVWLGNHYLIDSVVGVALGLVCSALTILIDRHVFPKIRPSLGGDRMYAFSVLTVSHEHASERAPLLA